MGRAGLAEPNTFDAPVGDEGTETEGRSPMTRPTTPEERVLAAIFGKHTVIGKFADWITRDWTDDELLIPEGPNRRKIPVLKRGRLLAARPMFALDEHITVRRYWRTHNETKGN